MNSRPFAPPWPMHLQVRPKYNPRDRRPSTSLPRLAASRGISPAPHAVLSGGILGGAPPSLLRTARAALRTVRTSLKSSRAGSEMSRARASCERDARVRAAALG